MNIAIKNENISRAKDEESSQAIAINLPYQKNQASHQSRITELSPKQISIERLRVIWNDNDETYADEELLMIRDWCYAVAEVTVSIVTSQRTEIQSGAAEPAGTKTHAKESIPLPAYDKYTTRSHEATEESHSLHPRIYRRAS